MTKIIKTLWKFVLRRISLKSFTFLDITFVKQDGLTIFDFQEAVLSFLKMKIPVPKKVVTHQLNFESSARGLCPMA